MSEIDWKRVVSALRDVAAKADETITIKRQRSPNDWTMDERLLESTQQRFSQDYLMGRIVGIADTIEAMLGDQPA